jgi:CheY-like chemotaxis protein
MMAKPGGAADPQHEKLRVLVVDNDENIAELIMAILTDEGYAVTTLTETDHDAIAEGVGRLEPDCILLDGAGSGPEFGGSWAAAAYYSNRARPVPTIMFTAHADAVHEAREGTSARARAAGFAAVVGKPFGLDELVAAVEQATGQSHRFDRSEDGERARTAELVTELEAAGATDIRASDRREWATFVSSRDQRIYQLYWWQSLGRYMLGRYDAQARLELIGRHFERRAAIQAALFPATSAP